MFGNKNRLSQEEIRVLKERLDECHDLCSDMKSVREVFGADITEIREASDRLEQDAQQAATNIESESELTQLNIENESLMLHEIEQLAGNLRELDSFHASIEEKIKALSNATIASVDQNKHFTTPSKEISEIPITVRENTNKGRAAIVKMSDYSKQMSVLSLNAAIEAGRMGEQGKDFVKAAEEIRGYTVNYNAAIAELTTLMDEQEAWSAKIDEQIHHLIGLLKESNISTTKLMKQNNEIVANINKTERPDWNQCLDGIKDKVIGIRNSEEELLKLEERNRMQLGYITEELMSSRNNVEEVVEKVEPVFNKADDIRGKIEREDNAE